MDGIDISSIPDTWSRVVSYVPQSVFLMDDTIRGNVEFGTESHNDEAVWEALKRASLDEFVGELPDGLYGDAVRVRQIMTNILGNAVKYTDEGRVYFKVTGTEAGKNTDGKDVINLEITVSVHDCLSGNRKSPACILPSRS